MIRRPPRSTRTDTLFPNTTLFRSHAQKGREAEQKGYDRGRADAKAHPEELGLAPAPDVREALEAAQWLVDLPDYSGPAMGRAILQLASALARLKGGGDGDRTGCPHGRRNAARDLPRNRPLQIRARPRSEEGRVGEKCVSTG